MTPITGEEVKQAAETYVRVLLDEYYVKADYPHRVDAIRAVLEEFANKRSLSAGRWASSDDAALLDWFMDNDCSWGSSAEWDKGDWKDTKFLRVPCSHTYEWHCYEAKDGDARGAICEAMAAGPCKEDGIHGCTKRTGFWNGDTLLRARVEAAKTIISGLERDLKAARSPAPPMSSLSDDELREIRDEADELIRSRASAVSERPHEHKCNRGGAPHWGDCVCDCGFTATDSMGEPEWFPPKNGERSTRECLCRNHHVHEHCGDECVCRSRAERPTGEAK